MRSQALTNRTGREVAQGERDERTPVVLPQEAPAQVLALQRAAGNRAVADLLQAKSGPVVARALPADPTELDDYESVREKIRFDKAEVPLGDLEQYFLGARAGARKGLTVGIHFSGVMAAPGADQAEEDAVRDWLANIGMTLFNLHDVATDEIRTGRTRIDELDLGAHGGQNGQYRFTSVVRARAGPKVHGERPPSEVDLLVEFVGPVRAAGVPWNELSEDRRQALLDRFARFGFIQGSSAVAWTDDDFGKVLQALELIPDNVLASVRDMTFERGMGATSVDGESGHYEFSATPPVRALTLFGAAFSSDYELRFTVAHELGHAISRRPTEDGTSKRRRSATKEYKKAANLDGGLAAAITDYGSKKWEEHFSEAFAMFVSEPDTLKALRPHTHAHFETLTGGL